MLLVPTISNLWIPVIRNLYFSKPIRLFFAWVDCGENSNTNRVIKNAFKSSVDYNCIKTTKNAANS